MITRCPSCGASNSLDALVNDAEAVRLLTHIFQQNEVGAAFLRYLALHRPRNRALTNERIAKLLNEILPDFEKGEIMRNGKPHPAPKAAWLWAINEAVKSRDSGTLIPPLKGHGYLYEVISRFKPESVQQPKYSATASIAPSITSQIGSVLKPVSPPQPTLDALAGLSHFEKSAYLLAQKQPSETLEQCYQRLLDEQEQQQGA